MEQKRLRTTDLGSHKTEYWISLQVDIEGAELKALPEWISSGILDQVSQFGLEIHTDIYSIVKERIVPELTNLVSILSRQLYGKARPF